jgi:hypothetical protein
VVSLECQLVSLECQLVSLECQPVSLECQLVSHHAASLQPEADDKADPGPRYSTLLQLLGFG